MKNLFTKPDSKAAEVASTFRFELPEPAVSGNSTPKQPLTPSSASTPRHDYNDPNIFYVHRDFFATCDEQLSVFLDDELEILEEIPGGAWTRVRERQSGSSGLIPTDILESGAERLAKENKSINQDLIRVHSCFSTGPDETAFPKPKERRRVSFAEKSPDVHLFSIESSPDTFQFPYLMEDGSNDALASVEATLYDFELGRDQENTPIEAGQSPSGPTTDLRQKGGIFSRLAKSLKLRNSRPKDDVNTESKQILRSLESFTEYEDHLIRVYTGNFDSVLHGFKTFIVDEAVPLGDFTSLVVESFDLAQDGFEYELNLINHLTAEVIPLELNMTVAQIIELTKREALAFTASMPKELKKAQKSALKKMKTIVKTGQTELDRRDKSSDYVTPFKFVLNRIYREQTNAPIWIHVHLSGGELSSSTSGRGANNLVINSLSSALRNCRNAPEVAKKEEDEKKPGLLSKIFHKNKKKRNGGKQESTIDVIERIRIGCDDSILNLIGSTLEHFGVPSALPGISFEASLPAIHDASKKALARKEHFF